MRTLFLNQFLRMAPLLAAAKVLAGCGQEGSTGDAGIPPLPEPADGGGVDASQKKKFEECFGAFRIEVISQGLGSSVFVPREAVLVVDLPQMGLSEFDVNLKLVGPPDPPLSELNAWNLRASGEPMSKFGYSNDYPNDAATLGFTYAVSGEADLVRCEIPLMTLRGTYKTVDATWPTQAKMAVVAYPGGVPDLSQETGNILDPSNLAGGTAQVSLTAEDIQNEQEVAICDGNCQFVPNAADPAQPTPTRVAVKVRR
jgi:hypothetical protein